MQEMREHAERCDHIGFIIRCWKIHFVIQYKAKVRWRFACCIVEKFLDDIDSQVFDAFKRQAEMLC